MGCKGKEFFWKNKGWGRNNGGIEKKKWKNGFPKALRSLSPII
jgi:hypothetical protein